MGAKVRFVTESTKGCGGRLPSCRDPSKLLLWRLSMLSDAGRASRSSVPTSELSQRRSLSSFGGSARRLIVPSKWLFARLRSRRPLGSCSSSSAPPKSVLEDAENFHGSRKRPQIDGTPKPLVICTKLSQASRERLCVQRSKSAMRSGKL